ncbi:hypothetical protein U1738_18320 [Sphingomonas sp. GB1N7]
MKVLVAAAFLLATPVIAQTPPAQPDAKAEAPKAAKSDADRKICRKDTRTSTRLVKRTCRTAAEWHELDQDTTGADNIVRNPS